MTSTSDIGHPVRQRVSRERMGRRCANLPVRPLPAEPSREKIGCTHRQPASWWTAAAATSGLSSKRGARPTRGVAQRAVGLVNGFVNDGIQRRVNVRSARRRQERAHQRRWRRQRSRRSRCPPAVSRSPGWPPPGRSGVSRASPPRVARPGPCRGCHERGDGVAGHRHVEREFDVPDCAEAGRQPHHLGPGVTRPRGERDRIRQVGRQRPGLRAMYGHHHRRMEVRAIEFSQRRDSVAHLRQPLARCRHRKAQLAQFVLDPGSPGADAPSRSGPR